MVVVVDCNNHRLVMWWLGDGTVWKQLGSQGKQPGQFTLPWAVALTSTGALVVTDKYRVQVLTVDGAVLCVLDPTAVAGVGQLGRGLLSVTVCDDTDEILVTDADNHRVVALTWSPSSEVRHFPSVIFECASSFLLLVFFFILVLLIDIELSCIGCRALPVSARAHELGAARARRSGNSTSRVMLWPCRWGACG